MKRYARRVGLVAFCVAVIIMVVYAIRLIDYRMAGESKIVAEKTLNYICATQKEMGVIKTLSLVDGEVVYAEKDGINFIFLKNQQDNCIGALFWPAGNPDAVMLIYKEGKDKKKFDKAFKLFTASGTLA